jgi:hypothetical protein
MYYLVETSEPFDRASEDLERAVKRLSGFGVGSGCKRRRGKDHPNG